MNKNTINQEMQYAYEALKEANIANKNGEIEKTFRGQISSFGAAVTMGSLLPAIAFFSKDGGSEVSRSNLMEAVLLVLKKTGAADQSVKSLYDYAYAMVEKKQEGACREEILNAAIALKLAMNLYTLVSSK